jgi:hypothetical protein
MVMKTEMLRIHLFSVNGGVFKDGDTYFLQVRQF